MQKIKVSAQEERGEGEGGIQQDMFLSSVCDGRNHHFYMGRLDVEKGHSQSCKGRSCMKVIVL